MAAKGAVAKEAITKQILDTFKDSFQYEKEIRIPYVENGNLVQIKVTLTCAKENVNAGADKVEPGTGSVNVASDTPAIAEMTKEEKQEVNDLISALGL